MTTYLVQIINKPYQVLLFQVFCTFFIRLPVEYLVEFVAEIRGRSVEAMELLQDWVSGRSHKG